MNRLDKLIPLILCAIPISLTGWLVISYSVGAFSLTALELLLISNGVVGSAVVIRLIVAFVMDLRGKQS